jgi:hypothetical protein
MSALTYLAGVHHAAGRMPRRYPNTADTRTITMGSAPPTFAGAIAVAVNTGERREVLVRLLDEIEAVIAADKTLPHTGAQA